MLNMQNVKDIEITEGDVRTIHDKDNRLIWGRLAYDTKYAGDTYQQTYSGKNLLTGNYSSATAQGVERTWDNVYVTLSGTTSNTYANISQNNIGMPLDAGTYTFSTSKASSINKAIRIKYNDTNYTYIIEPNTTSITFAIPDGTTDAVFNLLYISGFSSGLQISDSFGLMLEKNSSPTSFEPYTGGIPAPNPDYPQDVQVVTGEQKVTISDGVDSEDFTISLGTIELCKLGNYRDKIFNNDPNEDWYDPDLEDNAWYVHKECEKVVFNGSENWNYNNVNQVFGVSLDATFPLRTTTNPYCDNYIGQTTVTFNMVLNKHISLQSTTSADSQRVLVKDLDIEQSFEAFKTWLSTHNTTLYYPLATPTDTQITDATLVGQLDAIHEWLTRYGYSATVTGNLPIIINQTNL